MTNLLLCGIIQLSHEGRFIFVAKKKMLNPAWSGVATKIKTKYKISTTRKMNELIVLYSSPAEFEEMFRENPYDVAINTLNKTFKQADDLVLSLYPEFETSLSRCRWCCWDILKKNEKQRTYSNVRYGIGKSHLERLPRSKTAYS